MLIIIIVIKLFKCYPEIPLTLRKLLINFGLSCDNKSPQIRSIELENMVILYYLLCTERNHAFVSASTELITHARML